MYFLNDFWLLYNKVSAELNVINGQSLKLCWITFDHKIISALRNYCIFNGAT